MPTNRTPLLLFDNVFDSIGMFPGATLSASLTQAGTDVLNLGDSRRERSYWTPGTTATTHYVLSMLATGTTKSPSYVWVDRGHNLWGKTVAVRTVNTVGATLGSITLTVPALNADGTYTPGGDPTSSVMAVTDEGALYSVFAALTAGNGVSFAITSNWNPIIAGLMIGASMTLDQFATKFDEDAANIKVNTRESDAGWVAADKAYSWQTLELSLATIGDSTYDNQIRALKFWVYQKRQPVVIAMNYGAYAARAWLYQCDPKAYSFGKSRVLRSGTLTFRECNPRVL